MVKLRNKNINNLSYKDIVIYMFIIEYPFKTSRELSFITGCNYTRLTESINKLLKEEKIIKTETYPSKYMINE